MSQRVILNPAVKHIVDNLNIFGFGSKESALLQSVKELLENSIDACRSSISMSNPTAKRISISIKDVDSVSCALEVSDDGSGVADALSVLKVFNSSKDGSNPNNANPFATGRFGVGLSTCLVYSLDKCGAAMRMVTKCKEQSSATIADYSMDRTGQPQCVQNRSVNTGDFVSGTRIRVVLPLHNDRIAIVQKVCRTVGMYLVLLDCLPHSYFQIDLQASVDGYSYSVQTTGHSPAPYTTILPATTITTSITPISHATANPTINTLVTTTTNTADTTVPTLSTHTAYAQRYAKYLMGTGQRIYCSTTAEVQDQNEEVTVVVELILMITEETAGNADTSLPPTTTTNTITDTTIPVTVHRYVNHTPLLDYQQDALSCGIVNSLRSVKWTQYGYKLKMGNNGSSNSSGDRSSGMCLQTGCQETMQAMNGSTAPTTPTGYNNYTTTTTVVDNEDHDGDDLTDPAPTSATPITTDGNTGNNNSSSNTISNTINTTSNNATNRPSSNTLWQSPVYELVCTRPELCDIIQNKNIQLVLAIDVICRKVPYANMRKTSLSGDCPATQALIVQGVQSVLAQVEKADDAPGLFVSKRDYKKRLMLQRYLPSIANSIASMVMLCKKEDYLERVQELLDIDVTTDDGINNSNDSTINSNNSDGSDHTVNDRNRRTKAVLADCIQQKLRDMVLRR